MIADPVTLVMTSDSQFNAASQNRPDLLRQIGAQPKIHANPGLAGHLRHTVVASLHPLFFHIGGIWYGGGFTFSLDAKMLRRRFTDQVKNSFVTQPPFTHASLHVDINDQGSADDLYIRLQQAGGIKVDDILQAVAALLAQRSSLPSAVSVEEIQCEVSSHISERSPYVCDALGKVGGLLQIGDRMYMKVSGYEWKVVGRPEDVSHFMARYAPEDNPNPDFATGLAEEIIARQMKLIRDGPGGR